MGKPRADFYDQESDWSRADDEERGFPGERDLDPAFLDRYERKITALLRQRGAKLKSVR